MFSNQKPEEQYKSLREAGPYLGLGTQMAATIVLMLFAGKYLDEYFNTYPLLMIIFAFLGGFAGIYNFILTVLKLNKTKKKIDKK